MATATKRIAAGHAEVSQLAVPALTAARREHRCECGHTLRVFGLGRHRVYFELTNKRFDDPVMNGACPACQRPLPGKNPQ